MQFVLMRHATRASSFDNDCALSALGHAQAGGASALLTPNGRLPRPDVIFCSPKLRARQTLLPLSQHLGLELIIDARLDERSSHESQAVFESRIQSFLNEQLHDHPQRLPLVCSHMDWLEAALPLVPSTLSELERSMPWGAGEFRVFEVNHDGIWAAAGKGILYPA